MLLLHTTRLDRHTNHSTSAANQRAGGVVSAFMIWILRWMACTRVMQGEQLPQSEKERKKKGGS